MNKSSIFKVKSIYLNYLGYVNNAEGYNKLNPIYSKGSRD